MIPPGGLDEGKRYLKEGEALCPKCYKTLPEEEHDGSTMVVSDRIVEQLASREPEPDYSPRPKTSKLSIKAARRKRKSTAHMAAVQRSGHQNVQGRSSGMLLLAGAATLGLVIAIAILALVVWETEDQHPPKTDPRPPPVVVPAQPDSQAMYAGALDFWNANPGLYAEATTRFEAVRKAAGEGPVAAKAAQAIAEIRAAQLKDADVVFLKLRDRSALLAGSGDYDGALKLLGQAPGRFARELGPRLLSEREKLRKEVEKRLKKAITAAEQFSRQSQAQRGIEVLGELKSVKYTAFAARLDVLRKRLEGEAIAALKRAARAPLGPIVYTTFPFDSKEAARRQTETAERLGLPITRTLELPLSPSGSRAASGKGIKLELVLIPAGEFLMGSKYTVEALLKRDNSRLAKRIYKREVPRHRVRITRPYYLGRTEVTQAQWQQVMGTNPVAVKKKANNPVHGVNWNQCQEFVKKLSAMFNGDSKSSGQARLTFRLPTEAEWEKACRAGTDTPFHFGEQISSDLANYNGQLPWDGRKSKCRGGATLPGSFKANSWGLHDMAGNVWERCQDRYGVYPKTAQTDPKGPEKGSARVARGGSCYFPPGTCRSASRTYGGPTQRSAWFGLRILLVVPQKVPAKPRAGLE
jgi:formylglycine-generating enzyme required for sulfatase activity